MIWYEDESKDGAKSEKLSRQFSQMESNMNLQEIPKLIPIPKKKAIKRKRWLWWKVNFFKIKKLKKNGLIVNF